MSQEARRKWIFRFTASMVVYTILIFITSSSLDRIENDVVRALVAALPILPTLSWMIALIAALRAMDELEQRVQLEGFAFSVGIVGPITFTMGLLENAGITPFGMIWVFPMLIACWGIGTVIARRGYY